MRRGTWVLVASSSFSAVGWGICWPYLLLRLYDIGATYLQLCLMDSLAAVMYLSSRFWGSLSDYYGRRRPFILAGFTASASPVAVMAVMSDSVWALLLSYLASCFFWSIAYPAYVAAITTDPEREKAMAILLFIWSAGFSAGQMSIGPVEALLGPPGVFAVSLVVLLASPALLALYPERPIPKKPGSAFSYAKGAFAVRFRAGAGFGFLLLGAFLSWLGLQWATPLVMIKLYDLLGRSKFMTGLLMGICSVIETLALIPARRAVERFGALRILAISTACRSACLWCLAVVNDLAVYSALWLTPLAPFFNLSYTLSPAELTPEDVRGEAVGSCEVARSVGVLLGLSGGILADLVGRETSLALSAIPLAIAVIPFAMSRARARKAILRVEKPCTGHPP